MLTRLSPFQAAPLVGRVKFEVPWEEGEDIRQRLAGAGIPATLWVHPYPPKAAIEIPAHVGRPEVLAVLGLREPAN
jgi:hypothetical protein